MFVDFEGHRETPAVAAALAELGQRTLFLKVLARTRPHKDTACTRSGSHSQTRTSWPRRYEARKPIEELERELGIHDAIKTRLQREPAAALRARAEGDRGRPRTLNRYPRQRLLPAAGARKKHGLTSDHVVLATAATSSSSSSCAPFLRPGTSGWCRTQSFVV